MTTGGTTPPERVAGAAESGPSAAAGPDVLAAAPRRTPGTRTRAGNAMERSREALLDGAARSLAERGVRGTTMSEVVRRSGVARATAYNHFRTREHLWHALAERELGAALDRARDAAADDGPGAALAALAGVAGAHPVLARLRADGPADLAALLAVAALPGSRLAAGLGELLGRRADGPAVAAALRWLLGCAVAPAEDVRGMADLLTRALAMAPAVAAPPPADAGSASAQVRSPAAVLPPGLAVSPPGVGAPVGAG